MPNATKKVDKGTVRWSDQDFRKRSSVTLATALQFYTGGMLGITTAGYLAKFDDSQSMLFAGTVRGDNGNPLLPVGTAGDDALQLDYQRPPAFELAIASVAVTDIGKKVYASFDQTGVLTNGGTYGNLVGIVVDVVASGLALVEPVYDGVAAHRRLGSAKTLAATGTQTLTKWDINKTIFIPNTGAYTINLPAVAGTQAGDEIRFIKTTSNAVAATLDGDASENIDGATTLATLDAQYDTAILVSTGSEWVVLARDIA
jgi:hypothetical protein